MHSILKRSAALIASAATLLGGGMLMAGTAQADGIGLPVMTIHPAASTSYPKELVNGDFQTFGNRIVDKRSGGWQYLSFVDGNGMAMEGSSDQPWAKVDGWDAVKFGWKSNDSVSGHSGIVEVQRFRTAVKGSTGNVWGEIAAATQGKYLYQDIDTANTSDAMYTVRLKHASRNKDARDSMQVLVGAPGREKPVTMRRTIANAGDKAGEESTTITSTGTGQDDQWDTYEGTVLVPRGQDVTRFTFKSVADSNSAGRPDSAEGNLIDDVVFTKAYQLTYDANGGVKTRTSQIGYRTDATQGAVETVASKTLPTELVNGSFDYLLDGGWDTISPVGRGGYADDRGWGRFTSVDPASGEYIQNAGQNPATFDSTGKWVKWPGFDAAKFGWASDQKGGQPQGGVGLTDRPNAVELQQDSVTGNTYAEIVGSERGKAILQKIDTQHDSDTVYTVRFDHASLSKEHADSMQVLVNGKPVTMTRVTSNKAGDEQGWTGTSITTHATNTNRFQHDGQWATYEGKVTIPANTPVSTFTFKALNAVDPTKGNLIDNLTFKIAYRLSYDANGGTKKQASRISSKTFGKAKTARTEAIASRASGDELAVNGGFDVPKWSIAKEGQGLPWIYVYADKGAVSSYYQYANGQNGTKMPGLTTSSFAWRDVDAIGGHQAMELHREKDGNTAADVHAGRTVAQTVATTPGAAYTFSIRHSGRSKGNAGGVTLLTGPDKDHLTPVRLTRTTVSKTGAKYGDKTGDVGTVAYTHSDSADATEGSHEPWDHSDDWESYEGTVIIPAGQSRTMIAYRGVAKDGKLTASANDSIIDDLSFTKAYRLGYDGNGGTGQVPSRTETGRTETAASGTDGTVRLAADKSAEPESGTIADDRRVLTDTTARQDDGTSQRTITRSDGSVRVETIADTGAVSGCQVYYPAGTRITLATAKADSDCWDSSQIGKTNRTFYGWSANTDANDRDVPVGDTMDRNTLNANVRTEIVMPARAKTVYALWAINPTLSYNVNAPAGSNAPGTPASQTVPYNTAAADKSGWAAGDTGKIPGYRFDGWYTAPNGGNKYDFNTPLTGNVTVYAKWTANGYTVKYDAGGGNGTMSDQKFTFDVPQNLSPNTFTRDGYTFTDWKRADTGDSYTDGQQVSNLTSTPNGVVTLVAQWTPNQAAINYNANPPTGRTPGGQGTANWTGHTGDTPTISQNGWTVDGYTFTGWNTQAGGKGQAYAPGTKWAANGTLTLYAQWTAGEASLSYDGNGATGGKTDPQTGKTDEKINVRDNGFTRDGYTFVTWNTQADCKGNAVKPNSEWTLRGSSTLYACWAGNAQTLTYHGNGATGGNTAAQSGKTGDELTTNANGFTRDGYTFVRWDTAKDGSGTAYGEGKNGVSQYVMKPAGNDLYAIWKANPATIQYRNDWPNTTGSTPDTTGNTGDTVTISQNSFDRPGYTFTGWSTSKRGDPSLQPGDKHTLEPRTTTVWAQWKADPAHLVYNSNIGTVGSETKTVDGVVDQTVKTITNPFDRPGYTFSGWNTQADGKGKAYATGADYVLTANDKSTPKNTSVLYAQWKINGASLKFNPNGGIGHVDDVTGDAFSTVTIPGDAKEPKITRPGYRFVGWSTEKNPPAGSTFLQPGEGKVTLPAEGSTTVYAQWEPSLTALPFTGGQAQVPTIWLYAGFALMLIALGVMMPMLRMRMAATKRTGKHMPITGGKHAK